MESGAVQKMAAPLSEDCIPLLPQLLLHASELSSDSRVLCKKAGPSSSLDGHAEPLETVII